MDLLTILKEIRYNSYGSRYGDGNDFGNGNGDGDSTGTGNGYRGSGNGWGDGSGNGCGDSGGGCGNGYGDGGGLVFCNNGRGIAEIDDMKVYAIDGVLTAIESMFGAYAKGYTVRGDFTPVPCYVAMYGFSLAHGKALKDAFCDARAKEMKKLPEDERVNRFVAEHPEPEEVLSNKELFYMHHALTGSCEFGRREFCQKNNIDLESSMSISEFLALTENEYGGEIIEKIRKKYSCKAELCSIETSIFAS